MFGKRLPHLWQLLAGFGTGWLTLSLAPAQMVSPLADRPDWSQLEAFDGTVSRERFLRELLDVYTIDESHRLTIDVREDEVRLKTGQDRWQTLRFRGADETSPEEPIGRFWRPREAIPSGGDDQPLAGLRLVLDPGHLGGRWAKMEERWFRIPQWNSKNEPVTEGDMTLLVAKLLEPRLKALGAEVDTVRHSSRPTTKKRPKHFHSLATDDLIRMGVEDPAKTFVADATWEQRIRTLQWHSEKYFYRISEIRERARLVNERFRPDLVLCLHFNAEAWGQPLDPQLIQRQHLHLLINGGYDLSELGRDDIRFEMLLRLLQGIHAEEQALAEAMAIHMARETQLPAYEYTTNNVRRPSGNPYVYARNLLANRLYRCPVIYLEPYVMNSVECHARVQAGFYEGLRDVADLRHKSLYHEYADAVIRGLVAYYGGERKPTPSNP